MDVYFVGIRKHRLTPLLNWLKVHLQVVPSQIVVPRLQVPLTGAEEIQEAVVPVAVGRYFSSRRKN